MPTALSSQDISLSYCTTADVTPYLQPHTVGGGSENPITGQWVAARILGFSREIDGKLASLGARTPFPSGGGSSPDTPELVKRWTIYRTAAECRMVAAGGNAKAEDVTMMLALADDILRFDDAGRGHGQILHDALLEYVHNEDFEVSTDDGNGNEHGQLGSSPFIRLRNKGLHVDSGHPLVFVDGSNVEVFDSAGYPFSQGRGWEILDEANSVIALVQQTEIEDKAASVNYWFSWWRSDRFNIGAAGITGPAHYNT